MTGPAEVNERVESEWVEEATAFERIWSVMSSTYEPQSPTKIAERARVNLNETRVHLQRLVTVGIIESIDDEYRRPPESVAVGAALRLLDEGDPEDIGDRLDELNNDTTSRRNRAIAQLALDIHAAAEVIGETNE